MPEDWSGDIPIYKQLEAQIISWILNGSIHEGEALPSVRKLSIEMQINHLTVAKSFQALVDIGIVEKRRGLGMFVKEGAMKKLHDIEKHKFFDVELPKMIERVKELKIDMDELITTIKQQGDHHE